MRKVIGNVLRRDAKVITDGCLQENLSARGVYCSYLVSWALGVVLMVLYTWKGKWMVAEQAKD